MKKVAIIVILFVVSLVVAVRSRADQQGDIVPVAYLPVIFSPPAFSCADSSTNSYASGIAYQYDGDSPVRPADNHADKNIELRGYAPNADPSLVRELIDYGSGDPTQPPQLATLFNPPRVPDFADFHQVHEWFWAASPEPGTRGGVLTVPPVTAVSFTLPPNEPLHVPISGYDIGGGAEVIVIFADENSVTLHYTRDDTAARGYTVHVDNICTDPNLLTLYNSLDNATRNSYPSPSYDLPALPAGKMIGTTSMGDMAVAIVDTGAFMDTRSCNEWWQGYAENCPPAFAKTDISPLYLQNYANEDGCDWLGAAGEVLDSNRRPVLNNNYRVHIWGNGIDERPLVGGAPAYSLSGWEQTLFNTPVVRDYQLQLETMDGTAVSPIYAVQTRAACSENLLRFDFVQDGDS